MDAGAAVSSPWPSLPVAQWQATRDTLHLWTQVVGKVRLARTPLSNHWWNSTLYVTARGLTTSLVPYAPGRGFQMDFDFLAHRLDILTTSGDTRSVDLVPRPVADFHADVARRLDDLGLTTETWPVPVEIEGAIPFPEDRVHMAYDAEQAHRFWLSLVEAHRVFSVFRGRFVGKASPVHFFWGALDLAVTRFSGRPAPPYPRSAPNCGPHVMREAYSHEVSSAGYWPGGEDEGVFYSYAYPEPDGFREFPVTPAGAYYNEELGEFVLPYREVRTAEDPDGTLLEFLQSTYEAAATLAHWDRADLERDSA
ncbi:DUF5996 family protein [Streptomyces thermolineatus]|uniref:DUF5996 family protein n=1 Tax=Streptomyces thermolineatus TaxID=44033 RepID=A0ABN3MD22_9ACTN